MGKLHPDISGKLGSLLWTQQRKLRRAACWVWALLSQVCALLASWLVCFPSRRNLPSTLSLILGKWEVPSLLQGGPFDRLSDLGWPGRHLQAPLVSLLLKQEGQVQDQIQALTPKTQLLTAAPSRGRKGSPCVSSCFSPHEHRCVHACMHSVYTKHISVHILSPHPTK